MIVPYIFHRNSYYKENTNKINSFVQIIELNVSRGMSFSKSLEYASRNIDIRDNFKKIAILVAIKNILKNNQNINDELKEDIRKVLNDIKNSLHNESLNHLNPLNNKLNSLYIFGCMLIVILSVLLFV
jgi:CHASE3 domain sensor protein